MRADSGAVRNPTRWRTQCDAGVVTFGTGDASAHPARRDPTPGVSRLAPPRGVFPPRRC